MRSACADYWRRPALRALYKIFRLFKCPHHWTEHATLKTPRYEAAFGTGGKLVRDVKIILRCERCGDMKSVKP